MLSIFMLILSAATLNIFAFIGTIVCFLVLEKSYKLWKDWRDLIKLMYLFSLGITALEILMLFILSIRLWISEDDLPKSAYEDDNTTNVVWIIPLLFFFSIIELLL